MKKFEKILFLFVALIERKKNEGVICYLLHVSKKEKQTIKVLDRYHFYDDP